ncbi:hypothetical protein WN943_026587 [Citrus x changshan-huyou]
MGVTWKVLRTLATFETQAAKMIKIMNGAMNQLPKKLTCERAGDSIRANSVAHWFVKTSLNEAYFADEKFSEAVTS